MTSPKMLFLGSLAAVACIQLVAADYFSTGGGGYPSGGGHFGGGGGGGGGYYGGSGGGGGGYYNNGPPQPYNFQYNVQDAYSGNDFGQHESSDGNTVRGEYHVRLPDGRNQIVKYTADGNGYNANVLYEGQPHYPTGGRPGGGNFGGGHGGGGGNYYGGSPSGNYLPPHYGK